MVDYTFSDDTAFEGSDYLDFTGTATIFADTNTAEVIEFIIDDQDLEADETFMVILSNPVNAVIGDNTGVATITDNDNIAPTADAGPDRTVNEGDTITLDGSGSADSDDGIAFFQWRQISGPSVTLSDPNTVQPSFVTPPVNIDGTALTFQLTVEDNYGKQDTDEVSITINENGITIFPNDVIAFTSSTGEDMGIKIDSDDHLISLTPIDPNTITETTNRSETFMYGLVDLGIKVNDPGDTAIITIHLPGPAPEGYRWYKYTATLGWIDFSRDVISGGNGDGAEFNNERTQVKLYITDNGPYDSDDKDLIIKDPSGLAIASNTPTESDKSNTPTESDKDNNGGGCFIGNISSASHR
jgi:hypothetical protein